MSYSEAFGDLSKPLFIIVCTALLPQIGWIVVIHNETIIGKGHLVMIAWMRRVCQL